MHNQHIPTDGRNPLREAAFQPDPGLLEALAPLQGNERIRHLLKCFGLRTSLVRLKVIDALLTAAGNDRRLGVRGMHSHFRSSGNRIAGRSQGYNLMVANPVLSAAISEPRTVDPATHQTERSTTSTTAGGRASRWRSHVGGGRGRATTVR